MFDSRKQSLRKNARLYLALLLSEQKDKCHWCGCHINLKTATVDHLKPLSSFEEDELTVEVVNARSNLAASCAPCNNSRSNPASLWRPPGGYTRPSKGRSPQCVVEEVDEHFSRLVFDSDEEGKTP